MSFAIPYDASSATHTQSIVGPSFMSKISACGTVTCSIYTDSGRTTAYSGSHLSFSNTVLNIAQNVEAGYTSGSLWFTCSNSYLSVNIASEV